MKAPILSINRKKRTAKVRINDEIITVRVDEKILGRIQAGDDAILTRSPVTAGLWITDYDVSTPTNYAIHNHYNMIETNTADLILNRGRLYE